MSTLHSLHQTRADFEITDNLAVAAARAADVVPAASIDDVLTTPFIWVGTVDEIREQLLAQQVNHGIDR